MKRAVRWFGVGLVAVMALAAGRAGAAVTIGQVTTSETAVTIGPGDTTPRVADAFSVTRITTDNNVTALTVTLAGTGVTAAMIGTVQIASAASGGTVHGSVTSPATLTPAVTLTTVIAATITPTTYYVRITPASHAVFNGLSSGSFTVSARISAATTSNGGTNTYGDTAAAVVTIDNAPPAAPTALAGTVGNAQVGLTWTNPADGDLATVIVAHDTAAVTWTPTDGSTYSVGQAVGGTTRVGCVLTPATAAACTDSASLVNGTPYFFRAFALDSSGNYSAASASAGPYTPLIVDGSPIGGTMVPVVSIINPMNGAVLSVDSGAKVQIRIYSPDGSAPNTVRLLIDGVAIAAAPIKNTKYDSAEIGRAHV
jgi:hypothetical protein